jgi:hypothetical protein
MLKRPNTRNETGFAGIQVGGINENATKDNISQKLSYI